MKSVENFKGPRRGWRSRLHELIFEADTPFGRAFDLILIIFIIASVCAVMLDSIASVRAEYGRTLFILEWGFTIVFTIEYVLRWISVSKPLKYAFSFYGIIDFISIAPTYLSLLIPGSQYFLVLRILRVLRVFRVLKFVQYMGSAKILMQAMKASKYKIIVFLFTVLTLVVILGSMMYLLEGEEHGFTSIPRSIYWAIVTLTTVGYGDISPQTPLGQTLASFIMILGYGIIAVPTGIVTVEMSQIEKQKVSTQSCPHCSAEGHDYDAKHCKYCGSKIN